MGKVSGLLHFRVAIPTSAWPKGPRDDQNYRIARANTSTYWGGSAVTVREVTKDELIAQLAELRTRIAELEAREAARTQEIKALQQNNTMLHSILQCSPEPTVVYDAECRVLFVNNAFTNAFGWSNAELRGQPIDFVPEECSAQSGETLERSFNGEKAPVDTKRLTKDGRTLDVHISSAPFTSTRGHPVGQIVTLCDITERKQTERAQRESEQKYRLLAEHANDILWATDLNMHTIFVSQSIEGVLGFTPEERLKQDVRNQLTPESLRVVQERLLAELHRDRDPGVDPERFTILELDNVHKNGSIVCLETKVSFIRDENGMPIGVHVLSRDVTDRKKVEKALQESEEFNRRLVEYAPFGIAYLGRDGTIEYTNPAVNRIMGLPEGQISAGLGLNILDLPGLHDRTKVQEDLRRVLEGQSISDFEVPYTSTAGRDTVLLVGVTPRFGSDGTVQGAILMLTDIAERKRTEEELRKSDERLELALKGADLAIWDYNLQTGEAAFNARRAEMVGYSLEETEPHFTWWGKQVHPDDINKVSEAFNAHAEGRTPLYECEHRLRHKSGQYIWVLARAKIVKRDEQGNPTRIVGTSLDITERKREEGEREALRTQLLQAQKMEAIGTLTSGIAHDFNNLLTIINGFTEIILMDMTEDDPRRPDFRKILETGRKGADMVRRLLGFSRNVQITRQPLKLNPIVENCVNLVERTFPKTIKIRTILAKDVSVVNADALQVEQILMNLCINAKEAMPGGGRLRIETLNKTVNDDYCRFHPGAKLGPHVLVEVSDTGSGMSKETMDRVFEPFFTTKERDSRKGTGLGLSVARGIVEQHGGWMTCESERGVGTTFRVYFPAIEEAFALIEPQSAAESVPGSEKVLLVDDEEYVLDLGKRLLEGSGYTVLTTANGREALEMYAREGSNIALVILDLVMPQMGGEKCLEELLKINPQVKVIVSTGHSLDALEHLYLGRLVRGFVNKPYEAQQMVQAVREVLDVD
jgi:two-component system, cell cycle sensor histidine kinase and response regulator CckA